MSVFIPPAPDRVGADSAKIFDPWRCRWTREGMLVHDYMYWLVVSWAPGMVMQKIPPHWVSVAEVV